MIAREEIFSYRDTARILQRERDFVYLLPHPALRGQISNYTVTFPRPALLSAHYTVLPHGSATLVLSQGQQGFQSDLFGPLTKPCTVGERANQWERLLIVEFQPAGLAAFTRVSQRELTDRVVPFAAVHPALNRLLLEALAAATSLDELVARLDRCLGAALSPTCPAALQAAVGAVIARGGSVPQRELSAAACYSPRHLSRLFAAHLGLGPKTFSRLVRVNRVLRLLQNPRCSITRAAGETAFCDPSHLIRDFQAICGLTPQAYRDNMSDFYSEIAKF